MPYGYALEAIVLPRAAYTFSVLCLMDTEKAKLTLLRFHFGPSSTPTRSTVGQTSLYSIDYCHYSNGSRIIQLTPWCKANALHFSGATPYTRAPFS